MKDESRKKFKKGISVFGLVLILFLFVMLIVSTIQGNGNMVLAYLISITFVSILFYIAIYILKKR